MNILRAALLVVLVATVGCRLDTEDLQVVQLVPGSNEINFPVDGRISVEFDQELDTETVNLVTFQVARESDGISINGTVSQVETTALFSPASPLEHGTTYVATLTADMAGVDGQTIEKNVSWKFTTISRLGKSVPVVSVMDGTLLVRFNSLSPDQVLSETPIRGMHLNERLHAIDFNPADRKLYGMSNVRRLYRIDTATGDATAVFPEPVTDRFLGPIGFDFSPSGRTVRIVGGESGANLVVDTYGQYELQTLADLSYAVGDEAEEEAPMISGIAYSNNEFEHAFNTLYGIDWAKDTLVRIDPSRINGGAFETVGPLGLDTSGGVALDIAADGAAYASLTVGGGSIASFFKIDLDTGKAIYIGRVPLLRSLDAIAIEPEKRW